MNDKVLIGGEDAPCRVFRGAAPKTVSTLGGVNYRWFMGRLVYSYNDMDGLYRLIEATERDSMTLAWDNEKWWDTGCTASGAPGVPNDTTMAIS